MSVHLSPTPAEGRPSTVELPTRQCGRCRQRFAIEAGTHPMELREWWACPACADKLLPNRRSNSMARAVPHTSSPDPTDSARGAS